jgi:SAM-dependent methyltransferase
VSLNPASQYLTDSNLRARQRLWEYQQPTFDLVSWVLRVAGLGAASTAQVLDIGCGNGAYTARLRARGIDVVGGDLSRGMLSAAAGLALPGTKLVNADVVRIPFTDNAFDVVLAPHMLYHVDDRRAAVSELRRVLRQGGRCVAVTNGIDHMRSLRAIVESAVRVSTPAWEMRDPSTQAFSLENGADQLRTAFRHVTCIRATDAAPVVLTDASIAADYVASTSDHYQPETARDWADVVEDVRRVVQQAIDETGSFVVQGSSGAFVCE